MLLSSGDDWWNNACIGYAQPEWSLYARGYKQAADLLVMHIDERTRDQDTLVYPVLFLYRQYFELRLKHVTSDACGILDEGVFSFRTRIDLLRCTPASCPNSVRST